MIRLTLLVLANIALFIGLRVLSVLVFFLFGIGASASSEKYAGYMMIPALAIHLLVIWALYNKKWFVKGLAELSVLISISVILFVLGQFDLIPF